MKKTLLEFHRDERGVSALPIIIVILVVVLLVLVGVFTYTRLTRDATDTQEPTSVPSGATPTPAEEEQGFFSRLFSGSDDEKESVVITDSDGDGLSDDDEAKYGSSVTNPDTDGDGFQDGMEVENGFNPIVPGSGPEAQLDTDNDGLKDPDEKKLGTDINNPDTDGDGFRDGEEVQFGLNPLVPSGAQQQ